MPAVEQLSGPTAFGKYTLLARLATGGMGEVFLARSTADAGFQKLLVIKRLLPHLTDHPQFVNMFLDEARLAAQLHHPNICQIYELGKVGPDHYMAMEYVEGIQLATLLRGRSRAPKLSDPRLTCALLAQACEALHYAHNLRMPDGSLAAVVHRDVNPKNIMVTSAGTVKVLDFGVAKARGKLNLSRTGTLKGTYSYMSPEQLRGENLDRRSDVFSLGIIAWESVTGRRLFKRATDVEVWKAIAEKPIPRASALSDAVSEELDEAIAKGLSRDREDRFSTAREFALALEESLSSYGAPFSSVAIAASVERCFAKELEDLRSVVMRAQRANTEGDDDDDFDGPTRLFSDNKLQEQIALLSSMKPSERKSALAEFDTDRRAERETMSERPQRGRPSTSPTRAERPEPAVAQAMAGVPDLSNPDSERTLLGVGDAGRHSPFRGVESLATPTPAPPPQRPNPSDISSQSLRPAASDTSGIRAMAPDDLSQRLGPPPIAPPTFNEAPVDIRPNRRWSLIFVVIIVILGLAVGIHWAVNRGADAPEAPMDVAPE